MRRMRGRGRERKRALDQEVVEARHDRRRVVRLQRCVDEAGWQQNVRELDSVEQLDRLAHEVEGKRLRYRDLIAANGLPSGARS